MSYIRGFPIGGGVGSIPGVTIAGTPGSVAFFGSTGFITEDNPNFFWDNTNDRLGLGTNSPSARLHVLQGAESGGTPILLNLVAGTLTNQAASTEKRDIIIDLSHTVTFAAGALATQRAITIAPPTYAFASASTLTQASLLTLTGAPIAGSNATITHPLALRIDVTGADGALFAGDISLSTYSSEAVTAEVASAATTSRRRTLRVAGGAITNVSGGELIDITLVPSNVQFGSATLLALQEGVLISGPTYSATVAKTITEIATLSVTAPTIGTNVSVGTFGVDNSRIYGIKVIGGGGIRTTISGVNGYVPGSCLDVCVDTNAATNVPAGTEYNAVLFGTTAGASDMISWAGAPDATQRWIYIDRPRYARSGGASTITTAATMYIAGPPAAGTNITITTPISLWIASGDLYMGTSGVIRTNAIAPTASGQDLELATNATRDLALSEGFGGFFLYYQGSSNRLGLGAGISTSNMTYPINLVTSGAGGFCRVQNTTVSGLTDLEFLDNGGTVRGFIGWANASYSDANYASRFWILASNQIFFIANTTGPLYWMSCQTDGRVAFNVNPSSMVAGVWHHIAQAVATTGSPEILRLVGAAHTTLSNAEASDVVINLARTVQFGQNTALATQRAVAITAPTYSSSAATKTITNAATLDINAAPSAGTNVTITNAHALRVQAGMSTLAGGLAHSGNLGFYATTPIAKPTVSGSRADPEQALADLLTELANLGLITNSTAA